MVTGQSDKMLHCARCAYTWMPRKGGIPQRCPRCRSVKWNMPFLNLKCKRCGYEWSSHNGTPKRCPKCGTHQWNNVPREFTCKRCGNVWVAKGQCVPKRCPACSSREWDREPLEGEKASVRRTVVVDEELSRVIMNLYRQGDTCVGIAMSLHVPFSTVYTTVRDNSNDTEINNRIHGEP